MDQTASILLAVDKWAGIASPIADSSVFSSIMVSGKTTAVLKSLKAANADSIAYLSELQFDELMKKMWYVFWLPKFLILTIK